MVKLFHSLALVLRKRYPLYAPSLLSAFWGYPSLPLPAGRASYRFLCFDFVMWTCNC
uniref:Uncharacterized protein n=1 Tax=Picea glauca TaxID=3330 RepID=A0A101M1U9_PICGL|nr:hypothetical protein ABT39_MTgene3912 [Picea glauca]QHR91020.1 hypothetical protein Q903MT_gene5052 [Picea sitchensis]